MVGPLPYLRSAAPRWRGCVIRKAVELLNWRGCFRSVQVPSGELDQKTRVLGLRPLLRGMKHSQDGHGDGIFDSVAKFARLVRLAREW